MNINNLTSVSRPDPIYTEPREILLLASDWELIQAPADVTVARKRIVEPALYISAQHLQEKAKERVSHQLRYWLSFLDSERPLHPGSGVHVQMQSLLAEMDFGAEGKK